MGKVAVIDYGMGNLHSVGKALEKVSQKKRIIVTSNISDINNAERLVLPGVGAIKDCMEALSLKGLDEVVIKNSSRKPILAVCVGMQMLLEVSEENNGVNGLGILNGKVTKISKEPNIKVPHMGWNQVQQIREHTIWNNIEDNSYFYFVHSYACMESDFAIAKTEHGMQFVSAISKDNIFAVQFHPEKSQKAGLILYENFVNWQGEA